MANFDWRAAQSQRHSQPAARIAAQSTAAKSALQSLTTLQDRYAIAIMLRHLVARPRL